MTQLRELAHRRNDGLDVRLLWDPSSDTVRVSLQDSRSGAGFEVPVLAGQRPLDVFHHPFAYAEVRDAASRRPQLRAA
jgi:hypothetical protein